MLNLITEHIDIWTAAQTSKTSGGRGRGKNLNGLNLHGIKKLRELILGLAVRGKLVPQDPNDEPASVLLEKIAKEKARLIEEGKVKKQKPLPIISEGEKPFELPDGWEWSRLGDVINVIRGITFPASEKSTTPEKGRVACLRTTNVQDKIEWDDLLFIREQFVKRKAQFVQENDIVMSMANSRELVGKVAIVDQKPKFHTSFGGFLGVLRPTSLNPFYVMLLLRVPMNRSLLIDSASQTTNIANISLAKLKPLVLAVPPVAEQHRIVAKVDELMALCDRLGQQQTDSNTAHQTLVETLLATLISASDQDEVTEAWQGIANHFETLFTTEHSIDQLKQTILQLAIMGRLVPQDPSDEPVSSLLERASEEKRQLGEKWNYRSFKKKEFENKLDVEIPKHWALVTIADFAWVKGGKRMPKGMSFSPNKTPYVYIRVTDMKDLSVSLDDLQYIDEEQHELLARYIIEKEDLFVVIVGATIGKVGKVPAELDGAHLTENAAKLMFRHIDQDYLLLTLQSELIQNQFIEKTHRQAQPKLALERIRTTSIPMPPLAEQHRIVAKVDELMALCDALKDRLNDAQISQVQLADAIVEQAVA